MALRGRAGPTNSGSLVLTFLAYPSGLCRIVSQYLICRVVIVSGLSPVDTRADASL